MPRQVVATGIGGPEMLSTIDRPATAVGPGEVRIAVRAAGVNPVDYKTYSGGDPGRLPIAVGLEAAGVITEVGEGAVGPHGPVVAGDEVMAFRVSGAYTDDLVTPARTVVPKPAALGWAEAGGLLLAGATAVHTVTATALSAEDTVLIHGAAGGVGLCAVQLAVHRRARVIATASARNHGLLRELGADPVEYGPGLAERVRALAPAGVDAALDLVGSSEALDVSLDLIPARQRIVTIVAAQRGLDAGVKVLGGAPGADPGAAIRDAARLELADLAGNGALRVVVAATYPLEDAAAAHRAIQGGHTVGKIVLIP